MATPNPAYPGCIDDPQGALQKLGLRCSEMPQVCSTDAGQYVPSAVGIDGAQLCPRTCGLCTPPPSSPSRRASGMAPRTFKLFRGGCGGEPARREQTGLLCGERCAVETATAAIRCCADAKPEGWVPALEAVGLLQLGWACVDAPQLKAANADGYPGNGTSVVWAESDNPSAGWACTKGTWAEARALCESQGARLCTGDELRRGCSSGTGCGFDTEMVWSADEGCSDGVAPTPDPAEWCVDDASGWLAKASGGCSSTVDFVGCDGSIRGLSVGDTLCPRSCHRCPDSGPTPAPTTRQHSTLWLLSFFQTLTASSTPRVREEANGGQPVVGVSTTHGTMKPGACNLGALHVRLADSGPCHIGEAARQTPSNVDSTLAAEGPLWDNAFKTGGGQRLQISLQAAFSHPEVPDHPVYGKRIGLVWASVSVTQVSVYLRELERYTTDRLIVTVRGSGLLLGSNRGMAWVHPVAGDAREVAPAVPANCTDPVIAALVRSDWGGAMWDGPKIADDHACMDVRALQTHIDDGVGGVSELAAINNESALYCDAVVALYGCSADLGTRWIFDRNADGQVVPPGTLVSAVCPGWCGGCQRNFSTDTYWVRNSTLVAEQPGLVLDVRLLRLRSLVVGDWESRKTAVLRTIEEENERVDDDITQRSVIALVSLAACFVGILVVSLLLTERLTKPLVALKRAAHDAGFLELEDCHDDVRLCKASSLTEVAEIGSAFERMIISLIEFRRFLPQAMLLGSGDANCEEDPPFGVIAICFTDIVGSSTMWEADPECMDHALEIHNVTVRARLRTHDGYEVKTIGDSFMITFETGTNAVQFGMGVQQDLLEAKWPESSGLAEANNKWAPQVDQMGKMVWNGIAVRVGIGFGEAIPEVNPVTGRGDYRGSVVNLSSRLESTAPHGAVQISKDCYEATDAAVLRDAIVTRRDDVTLKGIGKVSTFLVTPQRLRARVPLMSDDPSVVQAVRLRRSSMRNHGARPPRFSVAFLISPGSGVRSRMSTVSRGTSNSPRPVSDEARSRVHRESKLSDLSALQNWEPGINPDEASTRTPPSPMALGSEDSSKARTGLSGPARVPFRGMLRTVGSVAVVAMPDLSDFTATAAKTIERALVSAMRSQGVVSCIAADNVHVSWNVGHVCQLFQVQPLIFSALLQSREFCGNIGTSTGVLTSGSVGSSRHKFHGIFGPPLQFAAALAAHAVDLGVDCASCWLQPIPSHLMPLLRIVDIWGWLCDDLSHKAMPIYQPNLAALHNPESDDVRVSLERGEEPARVSLGCGWGSEYSAAVVKAVTESSADALAEMSQGTIEGDPVRAKVIELVEDHTQRFPRGRHFRIPAPVRCMSSTPSTMASEAALAFSTSGVGSLSSNPLTKPAALTPVREDGKSAALENNQQH
eukprot:TRINITY_DN29917_c0_g1_i1.p1 TRINITY_DN29917_c0_g1~~TRINITY_DN29917_c0_g1_i1.p1  ORF type:complete len:1561 (+),score=347.35 TRINITY_DN29917_c0_g1_i1:508-4683(+)